MKSIKDFYNCSISQNQMYKLSGGKKTVGGSYMLDDVEMCYSSDRTSWLWGDKKFELKPCGCEC